jgi:PQQ-dependent dehydrogenase (methanol/ethanol family)
VVNRALALLCALVAAGIAAASDKPSTVDGRRIVNADKEPGQWLTIGRTYDEQRFSPLKQIHTGNVSKLGLAWFADFDTNRGQEATPLVIDGVLYVSTAWSKVKAYDAKTGKLLWAYDPRVKGEFAGRGCCDVVNRGLAAWNGKIYVASYDGRLIALDQKTGAVVWDVLTLDHGKPVTSTGAPRVANGKVFIGNAGAEFGVRGYISAYDAESGKLIWRFFTVPGDPSKPFEQPIMKEAAKTWSGNWWDLGGGATVWDAIVYDNKLNLVYFGTGNGTPWNRKYRGDGTGDNLFVASIVAVNADTGAYAWHYQQAPGEGWDYDATSPLMLADLKIGGKTRRVLMQASKNGYFYVLDAKSGAFISASNFVTVNWADGFDPKNGRPNIREEARYDVTGKPVLIQPGAQGAHSWHPMSYSPLTGLVYFSAVETAFAIKSAEDYKPVPMGANTGTARVTPEELKGLTPRESRSQLVAWDPVKQREVWRSDVRGTIGGGTLATAGGLVFQGTNKGRFIAYQATDGKELWAIEAQTGVVAGASSYELDGEQYIAQAVGYGVVRYGASNQSRLLVFKLGGTAALPPAPPPPPPLVLNPPPSTASKEVIDVGRQKFVGHCAMCHEPPAANRSVFPDLRYSPMLNTAEAFHAVVIEGVLQGNGMASFKERLSAEEVSSIRAYLIERANQLKAGAAPTR